MVFINDRLSQTQHTPSSARQNLSRFVFDPQQVQQDLEQHIVGQRQAVQAVRRQLNIIKAGLYNERRPLLTALFIGATGVGKTEMVRRIAQSIHGRADAFCRIDMNTLSQSHYSAAITGAPPGYVGSKENITLLNEELINGTNTRPGIVLFDEIEKASADVVRSLMNILDNGELTLASGQKSLSFRNTLIFMTSNIGSRQWQHSRWRRYLPALLRNRLREKVQQRALEMHFDTEFLNRIHCIERFSSLHEEHLPKIVTNLIGELNQRLSKRQLQLQLNADCLHWLSRHGFEQHYGARAIQRLFQQQVISPLADYLLTLPEQTEPQRICGELHSGSLIFISGPVPDSGITPYPKAVTANKGEDHD